LRRTDEYLLALTVLYTLTTVWLIAAGEARLDLYISLYILEYFILRAVYHPQPMRAQRALDALGYLLLAVFLAIVAIRVAEILGA